MDGLISAWLGESTALILLATSVVHVYWAVGGRIFKVAALPEIGGEQAFTPSAGGTFAVALALLVAAGVVGTQAGLIMAHVIPEQLTAWACRILAVVFLARGTGDFRLVGLFKTASNSRFAYWDSRVYSPLCLFLALGCLAVSEWPPS
jgi:hypothetical protein